MSRNRKNAHRTNPMRSAAPEGQVAQMVAHAASGASGIHSDQHARYRHAAGRTNRVGSRSAAKRAAIRDY